MISPTRDPAHAILVRVGFALLVVLATSGCAMPHVFGGETGETVYVASADLEVRTTPFATSKVIGRLALHEVVTRTRMERGFAHVVAANGRLEGWVDSSQLVAQLPGAKPSGGATPSE